MASSGNNQPNNQNWRDLPGPSGDDRSLREPKAATESRVLSILSKNEQEKKKQQEEYQHFTLPQVPSTLRANAKIFVPRSKAMSQQQVCVEDNQQPRWSVGAPESHPRSADDHLWNDDCHVTSSFDHMNLQGNELFYDQSQSQLQGSNDSVLDKFQQTLFILNMHPGNMEEYLRPICDLIRKGHARNTDVNNIVESLFQQSLHEVNFRYTGARICQYMSSNLKDVPQFSGFLKIFMQRCQKEFTKKDSLLHGSPEEQNWLRGLAMFMAEIFLNVETVVQDGSVQRLSMMPGVLMNLLQCLLSNPTEMNVKCSCQLFKLAGALIEDVVKNQQDKCQQFEDIFTTLQSLQESQALSDDAKMRIGNVVALKDNNWNRSLLSPPKKPSQFSVDSSTFQRQEPVFYNQYGFICSRDEADLPDEEYDEKLHHLLNEEEEEALREFEAENNRLTGNFGGNDCFPNDAVYDPYNFDDCADDGEGMGHEGEALYEEFLKLHLQQSQLYSHPMQQNQTLAQPPPNYFHQPPPVAPECYDPSSWQQPLPPHNYHQMYPQQPGLPPQHQFNHISPQYHQQHQQYQQLPYQHHVASQQQQQQPPPQLPYNNDPNQQR